MPFIEQHDMIPWYGRAAIVVGVAMIAWLGYIGWKKKGDFRITVRAGRVSYRGRFPAGRTAETSDFFLHDVAPKVPICVIGNWTRGRVLRISVQGRIGSGEAQRIRNFLKMTLNG
ncbi:MAG: hypothetical protein JWO87_234 [Phycisphaerales bacterium]|nr:hypothetical protein [Phycisphaerales bacterium]